MEKFLEHLLFKSRWLLAPLYIGLIVALLLMMVKFLQKLYKIIPNIFESTSTDLLLSILGLVDVLLVANLILMIIFSGYENFVSKIDIIQGHVDRPEWMGKVDYAALKLKVIGSIVAISSIELLKVFISLNYKQDGQVPLPHQDIMWLVIIHMAFVVSGVFLALTEKILHSSHAHEEKGAEPAEERMAVGKHHH
jgi:uncharacterized protein (TIGR00645 family)